MPWRESTPMSERNEFVAFASREDRNVSARSLGTECLVAGGRGGGDRRGSNGAGRADAPGPLAEAPASIASLLYLPHHGCLCLQVT